MCFNIISHKLTHDRRPLVTIDSTRPGESLINPYAQPIPCPCPPDPSIAPYLACPDHNCCRTAVRALPCPTPGTGTCPGVVEHHVYTARDLPRQAPDVRAPGSPATEGWHPLPALDAHIPEATADGVFWEHPALSALRGPYLAALETVVAVVDAFAHCTTALGDGVSEFVMSKRVLNEWEFDSAGEWDEAVELLDECRVADEDVVQALLEFEGLQVQMDVLGVEGMGYIKGLDTWIENPLMGVANSCISAGEL